jgi:S1-C subfamily serine protease
MEVKMKLQMMKRIWIMVLVLVLVTLACGTTDEPVQTQEPQPTPNSQNQVQPINNSSAGSSRTDLIAATVQIYGLVSINGQLTPIYSGSGTIINPNGMILTNAHVASPASQGDTEDEPDALAVGVMDKEDRPPVFLYYANVKAVDGYLDLAVIQITSTMDGAFVDPSSLQLPYVQLGNSDNLHVGDHINIFGFPGIGGDTITFTDGNVSGFTSEDGIGDRAWIKTDATFAGGNSGGLAANDSGYIIGGRKHHGLPGGAGYQWRWPTGLKRYLYPDRRVYQRTSPDKPCPSVDQGCPVRAAIRQSIWRDKPAYFEWEW